MPVYSFFRVGLCLGYHANSEMYGRSASHNNLGYEWRQFGEGFDGLDLRDNGELQWPQKDTVMVEASVDDYINGTQPFHVYYLTISGHMHGGGGAVKGIEPQQGLALAIGGTGKVLPCLLPDHQRPYALFKQPGGAALRGDRSGPALQLLSTTTVSSMLADQRIREFRYTSKFRLSSCRYSRSLELFTPAEGVVMTAEEQESYVSAMKKLVSYKLESTGMIVENNFYNCLFYTSKFRLSSCRYSRSLELPNFFPVSSSKVSTLK